VIDFVFDVGEVGLHALFEVGILGAKVVEPRGHVGSDVVEGGEDDFGGLQRHRLDVCFQTLEHFGHDSVRQVSLDGLEGGSFRDD